MPLFPYFVTMEGVAEAVLLLFPEAMVERRFVLSPLLLLPAVCHSEFEDSKTPVLSVPCSMTDKSACTASCDVGATKVLEGGGGVGGRSTPSFDRSLSSELMTLRLMLYPRD